MDFPLYLSLLLNLISMKKLILISILIIPFLNSVAQYSKSDSAKIETKTPTIQTLNSKPKTKIGKTLVVMSGASFIIGSLISYTSITSPEPDPSKYVGSPTNYQSAVDSYNSKQKSSRKTTALIYGIGGLTLALGVAIGF